jgi:hypothetical protein
MAAAATVATAATNTIATDRCFRDNENGRRMPAVLIHASTGATRTPALARDSMRLRAMRHTAHAPDPTRLGAAR